VKLSIGGNIYALEKNLLSTKNFGDGLAYVAAAVWDLLDNNDDEGNGAESMKSSEIFALSRYNLCNIVYS
jgi:hypothetical protein